MEIGATRVDFSFFPILKYNWNCPKIQELVLKKGRILVTNIFHMSEYNLRSPREWSRYIVQYSASQTVQPLVTTQKEQMSAKLWFCFYCSKQNSYHLKQRRHTSKYHKYLNLQGFFTGGPILELKDFEMRYGHQ